MTDIVERLRRDSRWEEADHIEHLRRDRDDYKQLYADALRDYVLKRNEVELLRAALKPFAIASDSYDDEPPARVIASKRGSILSVYDLRAAKAALE